MTIAEPASPSAQAQRPFRSITLNYISLYLQDLAAVAFYSQVFGPPDSAM